METLAPVPLRPIANGDRSVSTGRFNPGNQAAVGRKNPAAAHAAAIRQAFMDRVQPEDVAEIVDALLRQAKAGDIYSAKLILDRVAPQKDFEAAANAVLPEPKPEFDFSRLSDEELEILAKIDTAVETPARTAAMIRPSNAVPSTR